MMRQDIECILRVSQKNTTAATAILVIVDDYIAAARADGYRAGIEAAAKLIEEYTTIGSDVAVEIRALAPAATAEES